VMSEENIDRNSPLVCEGIVGDGCGGGRLFYIKESRLFAHDPMTKSDILLLENLQNAIRVEKNGCIITIEFQEKRLYYDLSEMRLSLDIITN